MGARCQGVVERVPRLKGVWLVPGMSAFHVERSCSQSDLSSSALGGPSISISEERAVDKMHTLNLNQFRFYDADAESLLRSAFEFHLSRDILTSNEDGI